MVKSLFSKLTATLIAVLIISFSITGGMLYYFLSNTALDQKVEKMAEGASDLNDLLNIYMNNQNDAIKAFLLGENLKYMINLYSVINTSVIFITRTDGHIVEHSEIPEVDLRVLDPLLKIENGRYRLPDQRQYEIKDDSRVFVKEIGDFYGLYKDTGVDWLTVRTNIYFAEPDTGNRSVMGTIIFSTRVPEVQKARMTVFKLFLISVAIGVCISLIFIYMMSRSITKPIKQISDMSKIISAGEFKQRLIIKGNDEVGELARNFNQMVDALENLDAMRREFIANVSHELRTPMTSVKGFIQGILDGTVPEDRQSYYLKIVLDEITRLNRLVNDLLDLAKMEAGEISLKHGVFDINELIRLSVIKMQSAILEKELDFSAEFETEKIYVYADEDAISRVIINLLHNAVKFTEKGGLITARTSCKKNKVIVVIEDTGVGIEKEQINRIWERFHKVDKSRSMDKTGVGLGLAIVRNILNEHRQEIWVESQIGKGTSFYFTLQMVNEDF